MKHFVLSLAALVLGAQATAAFAEPDTEGFYVGAGLGQFNVEVDDINDAANVIEDFDQDDSSWKIFAGWRFNPYIGVELDYIDFGGPSKNGTTIGVKGFAPYVVGTIPIGIFELFAQVGYLFYDYDVDSSRSQIEDFSDSTEDLIYGGGIGVVLFDHLDVRASYEIIDAGEADDANALWLTGAWRF